MAFIKSFTLWHGNVVMLLDRLSDAPNNWPVGAPAAGIRIEFNQGNKIDPVAIAGYWDPVDRSFQGDNPGAQTDPQYNVILQDADVPQTFLDTPDYEYVFFDAATLRRLIAMAPPFDENGIPQPQNGIRFVRTIVQIPDASGVSRPYQTLFAYPFNVNNSYYQPTTMEESMNYAIGIPCPPDWRPVAQPTP